MRAVTWQGARDVKVTDVPEPVIQEPTDAIIRVTSTAICGSDLHLYEPLAPFMNPGDVLGHETMGIVTEVGSAVEHLVPGDRVVVPFNIACGHCWACRRGLQSQCETTQVTEYDRGAALLGYSNLYGAVPGGQAEMLRVPQAQYGPVKVPQEGPDERYLYLSDILPTAWQAVKYADVSEGDHLLVIGLGPVGQLATRIGQDKGCHVIAVDLVDERLATARAHGIAVLDLREVDDLRSAVRDLTDGRGADGTVEAVGMEAHGSPATKAMSGAVAALPRVVGRAVAERFASDSLTAFRAAVAGTRRGGTVSLAGVYGGPMDRVPLDVMFDRGLTLRMGQCNVRHWTDELLSLVTAADRWGLESLATHHVALGDAAEAYRMFRDKSDGCLKVVLKP